MTQINHHEVGNRLPRFLSTRRFVGPITWFLLLITSGLVLGGIAAFFPATFAAKLGILMGGALLLVLGLLLPVNAQSPSALMQRLLFTLVLVSAIWPTYLSYHGLPGPGINPTRLVYWTLAGVWGFWFVGSKAFRAQLALRIALFRPFIALLVIYLIWAVVCAALSAAPVISIYYLIKLMIGPVLIFLVAMSCLKDRKDVDFVLMLIVIAALAAASVGMIEAYKQKNIFFDIVPSLFPQGDEGESAWAEKLAGDKSRDGAYRVMSTFTHPLTFGEYLALTLPLAVYLVGFVPQFWHRVFGLITIPAMMAGLYVAHTRSPLLAAGVVILGLIGFLGVRAMGQKRRFGASALGFFVLIVSVMAFAALVIIGLDMAAGRGAGEIGSTMARIVMFQRGISLVLAQPLVGYGPGLAAVTLGFLPGFTVLTIDSYYLSVAMESGLPGLALFTGLLFYPVFKGFIAGVSTPGRDGARLGIIVLALLGFTVVKSVLSLTENFDVVFLLIALLFISLEPVKLNTSIGNHKTIGHATKPWK